MTEQEKREKAAKEMQTDLHKRCKEMYHECGNDCYDCMFRILYDLGYRKEEEVRKETAKEIYKAVLDLRELMVNNDDALCILRNVESWAKEDGVEVDQ